jgi:hypothetical protein
VEGATLVGWTLLGGLIVFAVGASAWRLAYQQTLAESLPAIHVEQKRWRWIHRWMIAAMFVTPAGLFGLAVELEESRTLATMAAVIYLIGAVCLAVTLVFRLTVTPWAAELAASTGIPAGYPPLSDWAGALYVVHMTSAYAAYVVVGIAVLMSDLPTWLGWTGVIWGGVSLAGFVLTRFAGPFNPPILAHFYTGLVGVVLILSL